MKLASITLPVPTYAAPNLYAGHEAISAALLEWCQGYSRVDVLGAWVSPTTGATMHEPGYRYEFTSPDTQTARDELVALAYRIKTLSDEEAIFIVHANGNTEIVR